MNIRHHVMNEVLSISGDIYDKEYFQKILEESNSHKFYKFIQKIYIYNTNIKEISPLELKNKFPYLKYLFITRDIKLVGDLPIKVYIEYK